MDLILFGMQGSGKGTLGKAVAQRYKMQIFETGGALRALAKQESDLAKKVKSIIESGNLVPNEVVMEIVEDFMKNNDPNSPILFDGIPRSVQQAETLNELLKKNNRHYQALALEISEATALKRLTTRRICEKCKTVYSIDFQGTKCECDGPLVTRVDDNPEAIKTRLEAFKKETLPSMELYKDHLIKLDAEASISEVEKSAFQTLDPIMMK